MGDRINTLVRKPGAGDLHARFDERDLETGHFGVTAPDLDSTSESHNRPAKRRKASHGGHGVHGGEKSSFGF